MRISDWSSDVCSSDLYTPDMPFPARSYSLLMPLLRGRSHFCKHALRQAAIPLPSVSDDDKRVHAVIQASFEQALEFIDDRLIEIPPKPVGLRKKPHTDGAGKRGEAAGGATRCSPAGGRWEGSGGGDRWVRKAGGGRG